MARPSKYTPEIAAKICSGLAGGKSLRSICKEKGMPTITTVMNWLFYTHTEFHKEFLEQYTRAREAQAEYWADEIVDIADESSQDILQTEHGEVANKEFIARSRLRVDSRKWVASKLLPKYRDKQEIKHEVVDIGKRMAEARKRVKE